MTLRTPGVLIAAACLSLLLAACGGPTGSAVAQLGSTTTTLTSTGTTSMSKYTAALAYSRCMRSHGVPDYADPKQVGGGGIQISGAPSGVNRDSPVFTAAQESCRPLLPNGGQPTTSGRDQELARMLALARCMRAHGVSAFPDPTLSAPSNRAGFSHIMSNDGVWIAIPNSVDVGTSAFERAATACNFQVT